MCWRSKSGTSRLTSPRAASSPQSDPRTSPPSSTGVPLLVDFWAEWCGPCRTVTPVLAGLAEEWAGRIVVRKIDVDQFEGIWERFNFRGIPAMIMFRDGQESPGDRVRREGEAGGRTRAAPRLTTAGECLRHGCDRMLTASYLGQANHALRPTLCAGTPGGTADETRER